MGTLFKAVFGFAAALSLLHGPQFWSLPPALQGVKRDIAAARPEAALGRWLTPRNGTEARPVQAHRLHS